MKKCHLIILALCALTPVFTSCSADDAPVSATGKMMLTAGVHGDVTVVSRTAEDENIVVYISNASGPVRKYQGRENLPTEPVSLLADTYLAQGWAGDSVPASFDTRFYKGEQTFTVTDGTITPVNLVCKIANTAVSVEYDQHIETFFKHFSMTVGHRGGKLEFDGRDDRVGYFMMTPKTTDLEWTFTGTDENGATMTRTGIIANAQSGTQYVLNVHSPREIGAKRNNVPSAEFLSVTVEPRSLSER